MTPNTPYAHRATLHLVMALLATLTVVGCNRDVADQPPIAASPAPPVTPPVAAPAAPPSDKPNYALTPTAPAPVAVQPSGPNPRAEAARGLLAMDFATACAYLEFERFDPAVCDYFAKRANGESASLSPRVLEAFLRSQNVARRSGSVIGWFEEPRSYEVRVNGQNSILEVVDTTFTTTGRFNMWARRMDDEEFELNSGRVVNVPVYLEWPLADAMLDAMRARGADAQSEARSLFVVLLGSWETDRRVGDDEVTRHVDEWPAFLAAWRAARAAPPAAAE